MLDEQIAAFRLIERTYRLADDALAAIQIEHPEIARRRLSALLRAIEASHPALALSPAMRNAAAE
jgi:hypothetical protein